MLQPAAKGDQRVLHQIVRSLAPRSQKLVSRLRDPQGQLLGKAAALHAMLKYAKDTFCIMPDEPDIPAMQHSWNCTVREVQRDVQGCSSWNCTSCFVALLHRCHSTGVGPLPPSSL